VIEETERKKKIDSLPSTYPRTYPDFTVNALSVALADAKAWRKALGTDSRKLFFSYLSGSHLKDFDRDTVAYLLNSSGIQANKLYASQKLGLSSVLSSTDYDLIVNSKDDQRIYTFWIRYALDEGIKFHTTNQLHAVSECLGYDDVEICKGKGACTHEDYSNSLRIKLAYGASSCFNLITEKDKSICKKVGEFVLGESNLEGQVGFRPYSSKYSNETSTLCYLHLDTNGVDKMISTRSNK